jgi:hypothetical protein
MIGFHVIIEKIIEEIIKVTLNKQFYIRLFELNNEKNIYVQLFEHLIIYNKYQ